jgi:hypothetical protein
MLDMAEAEKLGGLGLRPFPDENPSTEDPTEATRWVGVYSQLIRFKEGVLAAAHAGLDSMSDVVAREAAITADLGMLEGENGRLRERLDFWKRRHLELTSPA